MLRRSIFKGVELYRGCNLDQAQLIVARKSAGGAAPNPDCGKPTEQQAIAQVGLHEGSGASEESNGVVEYSTSFFEASKWVTDKETKRTLNGKAVVKITIDPKYLRDGSVIENGMIAFNSAPVITAEIIG